MRIYKEKSRLLSTDHMSRIRVSLATLHFENFKEEEKKNDTMAPGRNLTSLSSGYDERVFTTKVGLGCRILAREDSNVDTSMASRGAIRCSLNGKSALFTAP